MYVRNIKINYLEIKLVTKQICILYKYNNIRIETEFKFK